MATRTFVQSRSRTGEVSEISDVGFFLRKSLTKVVAHITVTLLLLQPSIPAGEMP
jgi:hypothetical protein